MSVVKIPELSSISFMARWLTFQLWLFCPETTSAFKGLWLQPDSMMMVAIAKRCISLLMLFMVVVVCMFSVWSVVAATSQGDERNFGRGAYSEGEHCLAQSYVHI